MSLQEAQATTTSTEFVEWIEFFDRDVNAFHREDFYAAQIAAEIRRGYSKPSFAKRVRTKDMLLEFKRSTQSASDESSSISEEKMENSKKFWFRSLGVRRNNGD